MKMYEHPALEDFDYYWRLDSDSFLISRVFVDPIGSPSLSPTSQHSLSLFLALSGWRPLPWSGWRAFVCLCLRVSSRERVRVEPADPARVFGTKVLRLRLRECHVDSRELGECEQTRKSHSSPPHPSPDPTHKQSLCSRMTTSLASSPPPRSIGFLSTCFFKTVGAP